MSIKVCHVTSVHPVFDTRIFHKECKSLSKRYDVSLIAPNVEDQTVDNIRIYGVKLPQSRKQRIRSLDLVYQKMVEIDADVYHFHDPELMSLGVKIKKEKAKKIVFDSHEDIPQQILCKPWIPRVFRKPLSFIYAKYESKILKNYDSLVSVTPTIVERLSKVNHNTFQVTNYPVYKEYSDHRTWGRNICFTGGVSYQYQHHEIISSLDRIHATYIMAGPCKTPSYMERLKALQNWKLVDYRGQVPYEKCLDIMQESSAGLAILFYSPNVGYKKGTLGVLKIFEYMMVGIPVICTDFDLWKEIVEGNKCGICVNPYDSQELIKAVNYLMENPQVCKEMGDNGIKAVQEKYNWSTQEKILFEMYDKLLQGMN